MTGLMDEFDVIGGHEKGGRVRLNAWIFALATDCRRKLFAPRRSCSKEEAPGFGFSFMDPRAMDLSTLSFLGRLCAPQPTNTRNPGSGDLELLASSLFPPPPPLLPS
jgi:hypothetical protein